VLLERRTYLGAELTACLRPWVSAETFGALGEMFGWSGDLAVAVGAPPGASEFAFVPDKLKTALEDVLLDAGVTLLYAMRPIALQQTGNALLLEAAGKAGRVEIAAAVVVDATEQAVVARMKCPASPRAGAQPGPRAWRTIELTGVATESLGELAIPADLTPAWRTHLGYSTEHGHLLIEHAIDLTPGADPTWRLQAELEARQASAAVCRWLKENHPAFAGLKLATTSHELAVPALWRVAPDPDGQLLVASACADLGDAQAEACQFDPAALARLGLEAGARAAAGAVAERANAPGPRLTLPVLRRTVDVLVVGGGTSGAAAAIGAARRGAVTLLADMNPGPGGTGTVGGVDSYWFGRRGGFNTEVSAWVGAQHAWLGVTGNRWNIEAKMLAWLHGLAEAGVATLLHTVLAEVHTDASGKVTGALLATPDCLVEVTAAATVDATGDGDVAVAAGAPHVYGSDREAATMWYSLSPQVRPGLSRNNFTSTVCVGDPFDYTRAILSGRRRYAGHDHGPYIAPRETRHVLGDVRISLTDILTMRRWPDVINVHFSNHDVKGQNTSDWLRMGLIPPNFEIEIPYRAVVPQRVDGLLVTGKAISATHDSLPPVRMQADLENLGYVCGTAAALSARRGITPRDLPVADLQAALIPEGFLPADVLTRTLPPEQPPAAAEMQQWIDSLDDADQLYNYGEVEMDDIRQTPIPMVQICTAGPAILPLLRAAAEDPTHKGRLHAARALAWHGDKAATPVLLAAIEPHLTGDELPPRTAHIRYTQASPDHGAMPELAYLLHSLAMVRDPAAIPVLLRAAERLKPTRAKLEDQMSGIFHYVDAICDIAERLGHRDSIPALLRLHQEPLFRGKVSTAIVQPDFFEEREAYLELTIGRALARCGEATGLAILADYLGDSRRMLAEHAHRELKAVTGQQLPAETAAWRNWLAEAPAPAPTPWQGSR
jgi:hypothetical protein